MTKRISSHIRDAMIESKNSDCHHKHGSVLVKNGKIIARGYNSYTTRYERVSIHSEIQTTLNAIRGKKLKIQNSTMVVVRVNVHNELRDSMPCLNCLLYMRRFGVSKIIYSAPGGFYKCSIDHAINMCVKRSVIKSNYMEKKI